jgi:aspartate/methionine/tyrosine aminotransferase
MDEGAGETAVPFSIPARQTERADLPGGEGSVRICYAAERGILEQAVERLARFLKSR